MTKSATANSCSCLMPLFRGRLFAIDDWHCAGHDSPGRHEEWCIEDRIVITRRGLWQLQREGRNTIADPLQAILWNGQSSFRVLHPIGGSDDCTVIRLTASGSKAWRALACSELPKSDCKTVSLDPERSTFAHAALTINASGYFLHTKLLQAARQQHSALAIEELVLALLSELGAARAKLGQTVVPKSAIPAFVWHAREFIAKRYQDNLCLQQIADAVHCSPFHLARQFKRAFNMSLHQAIMAWRLRVGLQRVLDQPQQLSEIALDLGFASHSHFSDAFSAQYGCSPQQARRRLSIR